MDSFEELVESAERQPFKGWDFSYLRGRYIEARPCWDYRRLVLGRLGGAKSLLDLGTGGGEFLSSLGRLPSATCTTEGYGPNTRVALANLRTRGADVVKTWCDDNGTKPQRGALPFRTACFDIVIDRHESYIADEVYRVLKPGGTFITQQVGHGNNEDLRSAFHVPGRPVSRRLAEAVGELEASGFRVLAKNECVLMSRFLDVGAVVYLLKAIPWEVPGFSVSKFEKELREIHSVILKEGGFYVTTARFVVVAAKA